MSLGFWWKYKILNFNSIYRLKNYFYFDINIIKLINQKFNKLNFKTRCLKFSFKYIINSLKC